jgi:hypothetical protein
LLQFQVDRLTLKVDNEISIENKEKFVVIVMRVPMGLPLHNPKANYRVVHLAKGLVVPTIRAAGDQRWDIDHGKCWEKSIQAAIIWVLLIFTHKAST